MASRQGDEGRKVWRRAGISDFGMSDDGKTIAFGAYGGKLYLWEAASPEPPKK